MAKYAALTVRKLKPGSYDEWRKAWEGDPDNWPEGVHAYILRNLNDPDEIIAFGLTDRSLEEMRTEGMEDEQRQRNEAMAPHVESVGADGFYEVIDEVTN
ncbi:MAG: hypothetical protein M3R26_01690 [Actinomycetota bacterium]|nr:hypothetical protein [Actinomycetota bacterium]MDQ2981023.1 hypothetical protein [Actinomycetota bacterium]